MEEEENVDGEPRDAGDAGDGVPGLGFGERERHESRVATEKRELRGGREGVAQGEMPRVEVDGEF